MTEYKVALDVYHGPLDLLLYLIRREEVDIYDIPIAVITAQYLQYVELIRQLDPEAVSEFLVLASTLMEIKSRMLLPRPPVEEGDEEIVDPRFELVRQLLEYKTFKDAARHLDDAATAQAQKHSRSPVLPPEPPDEVELESIDIWDLFDAFSRLLEQTGRREAVHRVGVDDTPLALHAEDIVDSIQRAGGTQMFEEIFRGRTKAEMIGLFLALLELIRQRRIRAGQDRPFGPIVIFLVDPTPLDEEVAVAGPVGEATGELGPTAVAPTELAPDECAAGEPTAVSCSEAPDRPEKHMESTGGHALAPVEEGTVEESEVDHWEDTHDPEPTTGAVEADPAAGDRPGRELCAGGADGLVGVDQRATADA